MNERALANVLTVVCFAIVGVVGVLTKMHALVWTIWIVECLVLRYSLTIYYTWRQRRQRRHRD